MTITLTEKESRELWAEATQNPDPDDVLDVVWKLPQWQGQGYWRDIQLRQGLELTIGNFQMRDRIITTHPEQERKWLEYHFHFSGEHGDEYKTVSIKDRLCKHQGDFGFRFPPCFLVYLTTNITY
ncbi:MAG: hypothetical protein PUP91_32540 [Rhizonema sp. PD37]|nr:hypothetical protein [Rhizonema sp. PD37]